MSVHGSPPGDAGGVSIGSSEGDSEARGGIAGRGGLGGGETTGSGGGGSNSVDGGGGGNDAGGGDGVRCGDGD
jgi:hypothetical protein